MASKTDIVRITYKELESKVQTKGQSSLVHERNNTREDERSKTRGSRQKRPTQGIYRPPIRGQRETRDQDSSENWEDELDDTPSSDSKESSIDRDIEKVQNSVKQLNITKSERDAVHKSRSKRPEIQRYVPKPKILEQQHKESLDEAEDISSNQDEPNEQSPRKVDVKEDQKNFQITVVNEQSPVKTDSEKVGVKGQSEIQRSSIPVDPVNQLSRSEDDFDNAKSKSHTYTPNSFRSGPQQDFRSGSKGQRDVRQGQGQDDKNKRKFDRNDNRRRGPFHERDRPQREERQIKDGYDNKGKASYHDGKNLTHSQKNQGKGFHGNRNSPQSNVREDAPTSQRNQGQEGSGTQTRGEAPKPQREPRERRGFRGKSEESVSKEPKATEDTNLIPTMVFERRDGDNSVDDSSGDRFQKKPQVGGDQKEGNKPSSKRYSMSAMRRPRAGSISSDISNASDLSIDEETTTRILDWDKEVEREMAKQVHDESLKISEFLQNRGDFNDWDAAIRGVEKAREDLERSQNFTQKQSRGDESRNDRDFSQWDNSQKGRRQNYADTDFNQGSNRNRNARDKQEGFRQRRNSDGSRSRRDQRRKGSVNGRRSRDSSVSSVNSTRSYQSEGYDSWPRRRNRRRKNSSGSLRESSSREFLDDQGNMNLKVTFARDDKRQVRVHDQDREEQRSGRGRGRGAGRGRGNKFQEENNRRGYSRESSHRGEPGNKGNYGSRGNYNARDEYSNRNTNNSNSNREEFRNRDNHFNRGDFKFRDEHVQGNRGEGRSSKGRGHSAPRGQEGTRQGNSSEHSSSPHGGGLIKLPMNKPENPSHQYEGGRETLKEQEEHSNVNWGKTHSRDTSSPASQKMLFDPKNPNKPILIPKSSGANPRSGDALHFKEIDNQSPQSPQTLPMMPGFPPMGFRQGYPMYGAGFDPRFSPESPYGPFPSIPPFFYGYPPQYREAMLHMNEAFSREYQGDQDPDQMHAGRRKSQCRAMAEHIFQEALVQDNQLSGLLSRRMSSESLKILTKLRYDLQLKYEQIILMDLDVSNNHNVEQLLWKSVFYQVIEMFRKSQSDEHDDWTKGELSKVLDEGTAFFDKLLQKLQQTYNFQLETFLDTNTLPPENIGRSVKLALLSCQRTMINLGDIARYREQQNDSGKVNYGRARNWYTKAQQLAPKNGRPYNQLAILALYTRRKLDAVYYYMRSLAASNPFLTARESLMSLFDEARKKAESAEKKREEEREKLQQYKKRKPYSGQRIEIWVASDGTSSGGQIQDPENEDLSKLDAVELNKRFNLSFLNVHGKLFTKIGRESFPECCSQMLREFQALLKHGALGPSRLIQLVAINMFAIENTALKDESLAEDFRSELQEHAVQLGLDMFGILVDRCAEQLTEHLKSNDYPSHMFSRDLEELVPGVKKWTDWMICNARLWNPPPSLRDTSLGPDIDVWKVTAKFLNILKDVDISHVKLYQDKREGCDPVLLFEDSMLSGFVPLLSAPLSTSYVHSTVEKDIARDCLRIDTLQLFGEYLCGIEPPMLAFNVESKQYFSVTPSSDYSEDQQSDLPSDTDEDEDVVIESDEELKVDGGGEDEEDEHVRMLRLKKEELRKREEQQLKDKKNIEKLLEKSSHCCIEIEIHPIFLVPDTNCFIDHFVSMQQIISQRKFTVVVPLVVINELDGLAKGNRSGDQDNEDHAEKVKQRSKQTVKFLEAEFEKKNNHLKAQTSKGSTLETISFRSEESDMKEGNNDDLILSCCLHYCKDKAREFMPKDKDAPVRLYREVVLLTDDRNLRLKAHTHNVPVKDVPNFIKWSKVT